MHFGTIFDRAVAPQGAPVLPDGPKHSLREPSLLAHHDRLLKQRSIDSYQRFGWVSRVATVLSTHGFTTIYPVLPWIYPDFA